MPRLKSSHKNIRKLIRLAGKSIVVSLPIDYVTELKWRHGQKVVVAKKGRHLIIKDWKK